MISPSSIILEIGRNRSGQHSGELDFSLRVAKLCDLSNAEIEAFKEMLVHCVNRAVEEQRVRQIKMATPIPEIPE